MAIFQKLKKQFPKICENEPLKNHCTFRVGGPADFFYELINIEELPALLTFTEENSIPYVMIGRGTNVLFTDKGFRGLVIKNLSKECVIKGDKIETDSGVLLMQIIRLCANNGLSGLEPLYGLPGTIGGAIFGNAGVPEVEIGSFVKSLTVFNVTDGVRELNNSDILFSYRHSSLQDNHEIIMRAILQLKKTSGEKSQDLIKQIDKIRKGKQPFGWSAGSFFKNPSKHQPAGLLIDQAGLKNFQIGDAQISEKHANFFMNRGNATCAQILQLADIAKQKVKEKFGLELEMEVKIIGQM